MVRHIDSDDSQGPLGTSVWRCNDLALSELLMMTVMTVFTGLSKDSKHSKDDANPGRVSFRCTPEVKRIQLYKQVSYLNIA